MNESILETLKEVLQSDPFVPFQITATSGKHYDVRDPLPIAVSKTQVVYCFPRTDRFVHIRAAEIVSLETLQAV
jgi:hypothetical protein